MTDDKKVPDVGTQRTGADAQKAEGKTDPKKTLMYYILGWMDQELKERDSRQEHDSALNPTLRDIVGDVRPMRKIIVLVAGIVPLVLLFLLWLLIAAALLAWWIGGAPSPETLQALSALSTPVTALVVGTFAGFILVYSALVVAIFSQLKNPDDTSRKQNMSIMPNIMADAVKKSVADD